MKGWHLKASTDMQRNSSDTNVLFFHKENPSATSVICVSLNSHDKMRILGPESVYQIIKQSVALTWPRKFMLLMFFPFILTTY